MKRLSMATTVLILCISLQASITKAFLLEKQDGKTYFNGIDISDKIRENEGSATYVSSYLASTSPPKKPNPAKKLLEVIKKVIALIMPKK